ncbi:hypothetical protein J4Q44_G00227240 [Coregonus suidteri]|uniref:Uncharacterized protein n=1 Tax=Coregonus suidteri TaxID=861788 RepID=A0AAN8LT22_9TELE
MDEAERVTSRPLLLCLHISELEVPQETEWDERRGLEVWRGDTSVSSPAVLTDLSLIPWSIGAGPFSPCRALDNSCCWSQMVKKQN